MRDAFTHAHCDGYSDSNRNGYGYRHSYCCNFGDAYSNRNSDSDCNGNGYRNSDSNAYADSDYSDAQTSSDSAASPVGGKG